MSNRVSLSPRDLSLLRLLSWTPATSALLKRASVAFDGEPFLDERRVRERLQALGSEGFVRFWPAAHGRGGLQNYYKITPSGFHRLHGTEATQPTRAFFAEVSPSLFDHTFRLAEVIVEVVRASHLERVQVVRFIRENELTLTTASGAVQPDGFFRLLSGGRRFNVAFEIDNSTESLDSLVVNSLRTKVSIYDEYQDTVLRRWLEGGKAWERPRLRVVFLTRSVARAYHILSLTSSLTRNAARRLVYAATHEAFVTDAEPLHSPLFVDHRGSWQSLVELHPTSRHRKTSVFLPQFDRIPTFE